MHRGTGRRCPSVEPVVLVGVAPVPLRSCTDWGGARWRSPDPRGQANPLTKSQNGILVPDADHPCGALSVASPPRPRERRTETLGVRLRARGVSVRAGADSSSGDSARTDSAQAISSAPEPVARHQLTNARPPPHTRRSTYRTESVTASITTKPIRQCICPSYLHRVPPQQRATRAVQRTVALSSDLADMCDPSCFLRTFFSA